MESDPGPRRLLIALAVPAYAAGVAFLFLAVYLLVKGMQPGASQADWRPVSQISDGIEAFSIGILTIWFTRGATGPRIVRWPCVAAAVVAVCLALVLLRTRSEMEHSSVVLAATGSFVYVAAIAGGRLLTQPRRQARSRPARQTPFVSSTPRLAAGAEAAAPVKGHDIYRLSDPEDVVPPFDLFAIVVLVLMAVVVTVAMLILFAY